MDPLEEAFLCRSHTYVWLLSIAILIFASIRFHEIKWE